MSKWKRFKSDVYDDLEGFCELEVFEESDENFEIDINDNFDENHIEINDIQNVLLYSIFNLNR